MRVAVKSFHEVQRALAALESALDATRNTAESAIVQSLPEHSDVKIEEPTDTQVLVYSNAQKKWVNQAVDHGALDGRTDDDHTQYHTDARGDARYFTESEHLDSSAGAADAGKPVKLDAGGHVDASMVNDGDISHDGIADVSTDDHHAEAHTIESHNATDATGAELEELTDGSETTLHNHAAGVSNHAILDGDVHDDSVADGVTRGSIIYGNPTPKWDELVIGAANKILIRSGDDLAWGDLYAKWRTIAGVLICDDPLAGDVFELGWVAYPVTFLQVRGITDTGTATFNIERRVITTPATVGTDILDTGGPADPDLVAAVGGAVTTTFAAAGAVAADQWLVVTITSVADAPTKLWIPFKYSID